MPYPASAARGSRTPSGKRAPSGLTSIGRRARSQRLQIESLSSSTGAPSRPATNIKGGRKEIGRLSRVRDALSRVQAAYASRATPAGLAPDQAKVLHTLLNVGTKTGASKSDKLSAVETGLVESGLRNLSGGDGSSVGWRQETASSYPNVNRMNVKGGAKRFYSELKSAPQGTPGQRAQAVQRSAFPSRYDAVQGQAKQLLKGSHGHPPSRKDVKTLAKAGVKRPKPAPSKTSGTVPSVVKIGHQAEHKFGLHVGENPAFGGVDPVHASGSYHYQRDAKGRGEAIDVSGSADKMLAFDHFVAQKYGPGTTELFYDPGISLKNGQSISPIGGHEDHVHVAVAKPGSHFSGSIGGVPAGALSSYAASTGQSAGQVFNQLKSGRLTRKQLLRKVQGIYSGGSSSPRAPSATGSLRQYGHPAV